MADIIGILLVILGKNDAGNSIRNAEKKNDTYIVNL